MSRFDLAPQVRLSRTKIPMPHDVKTSMNVGTLYPISCVEVLPGDTWKSKCKCVARVTTSFLKPVLDNSYMDIYHFYVPYRQIYDDYEKVFGNANPSSYTNNDLKDLPPFYGPFQISPGTVGDYLNMAPGYYGTDFNCLPFRAFALIYDKWFRNENTVSEMYITKSYSPSTTEVPNNNDWSPNNYMGKLPQVSKKKDYFTACLPKTQKGSAVTVPVGSWAPVIARQETYNPGLNQSNVQFYKGDGGLLTSANLTTDANGFLNFTEGPEFSNHPNDVWFNNVWADLRQAEGASVNDLRFAFQLQKMLELDARAGSRYNEFVAGHFGVYSNDLQLQIPEYLGGARIPITVLQVAQTSQATESSPLGNVAGFSVSGGMSRFSKGFKEHGFIITVACIRTLHTYQQGVPKMFQRQNRNDIYDPLFANLGEQPVYKSELYVSQNSSAPTLPKGEIFGYNEAWAEYRFIPNTVTGQMRSVSGSNLDEWHFADKYASAPTLSQSFTDEVPDNFDRTVSAPSTSVDNFICQFFFDSEAIRVMPLYSIPGRIDH